MAAGQDQSRLSPLRSLLSMAVLPIQLLVSFPTDLVRNTIDNYSSYSNLVKENQQLNQQQLLLEAQILKLKSLEKENIRLRSFMETSFDLGDQVLIAELRSVNLDPFEQKVVINKGKQFGVFDGQPVINTKGIVGQVARTYPLNAEVILITDPAHATPIQINRNGLRTLAVGSGKTNQLVLPYLPNNADIKKGDLLVTSGLGGTFPAGYPVAMVTEVSPQPGSPFSRITATATANLDRNREMLLIWTHFDPVPLFPSSGTSSTTEHNSEQQ